MRVFARDFESSSGGVCGRRRDDASEPSERQNVAALSVDDHALAGCLDFLFTLLGQIEKLPKDRIAVERVVLLEPRAHRNVDDRRDRFLYHRR